MTDKPTRRQLDSEILGALETIRRAMATGAITFEAVKSQLSVERADLRDVLADPARSEELNGEKLSEQVDDLIDSWLYIWRREEAQEFQKRLENCGLNGVDMEKIGRVILGRLQSSLENNEGINKIGRLVTLLHDGFPKNVGGGGFTGMYEVPQVRKLLLERLLLESQSPEFKIIDTSKRSDPWSIENRTLNYLNLRLEAIYRFYPPKGVEPEVLIDLFQGHIRTLIN